MKNKILLIDDNHIDLYISRKIIDKTGIDANIKTFTSGNSAIDFLKILNEENNRSNRFWPNIILLDIYMPEMNGFQFIKEFNKLKSVKEKNTKIYILSSSTHFNDYEKVKNEKSCLGFINKPLTVEKINSILANDKPYLSQYDYMADDMDIQSISQ